MGESPRPTFGSLFSGIGGIDLGLERAGWECRWQCEADEWCRGILARHWPGLPIHTDARDLAEAEPVDLLAGGFPCQPVSIAGRRLAQDDPRWLWPAFADAIRVLRPGYVLVENVTGLFTAGFGDVLGDLASLGFDAEWGVLSAADVGAPHRRDRVFILAYVADADGAGPQGHGGPVTGTGEQSVAEEGVPGGDGEPAAVADADSVGREWRPGSWWEKRRSESSDSGWWSVEPDVGRMAHGVPNRVDRLRGLGNSVVPQVAEVIGRRLMERCSL